MKKLFLALAILLIIIAAKFLHTRIVVEKMLGPSSVLAILLLACVIFVLLASYVLIDGKHREKVLGFWTVIISTGTTYLVVDLVAGFFLIAPLSPQLVPDEYRHHKLVPNAQAFFDQQDFSYVQRNNSLGLRGREIIQQKPEDTFRVLMLGDSFTMGKGVEDNETFSALAEERLNVWLSDCASSFNHVEVINGGVDSYSPILSYIYLSRELIRLDPDLVVLNLDNSDLVQEAAYRKVAVRDETGNIVAVPGSEVDKALSERFRDWIQNNLFITRLALFYTNKLLGHKDLTVRGVVTTANSETLAHTLDSDDTDRKEQWNDIFDSLRSINRFAGERYMGFLLVLYPWGHQVSDTEWVPGRDLFLDKEAKVANDHDVRILSMAANAGIPATSLYPLFMDYQGPDKLYFDHDMHLTKAGHELMAAGIVGALIDMHLAEHLCEKR